ncbi:MAG: cell division protein FtsZ [Bacteroidota bacterium]
METRLKFDLPKDKSSIIKVLGVGGGGGNAVNHMYAQGIKGVDFVICNTDLQVLEASPIPNKIQLGSGLTQGLGAGSNPEVGKKAAMEAIEDIIEVLGVNTKMLFITAGMGGGTGTGAAPIIAKTAKELDILTVGIVTLPFSFEGKKRKDYADEGIENLKRSVDCLLVIGNDKIKQMYGNLPLRQAFSHANDILTTAAKGIAELITYPGYINVDFEDVKTVMKNSGVAIMGSATAEGENRALEAVKTALASPLLNDNQIFGAKNILLNITSGSTEVLMDEVDLISNYIQSESGLSAEMIFGTSYDESLGEKLAVTIIATGFEPRENKIILQSLDENFVEQKQKFMLHEPTQKEEMIITTNIIETPPEPEIQAMEIQEEEENEMHFELKIEEEEVEQIEEINEEVQFEETHFVEETNDEDDEIKFRVQDVVSKEEQIEELMNEVNNMVNNVSAEELNDEQEIKIEKHIQRIKELKNLNVTINSPGGIRDLEKEPAYKRKNKKLNEVPHSSEQQISRLTLFEDSVNNKAEIRTNNSFLHDNVD